MSINYCILKAFCGRSLIKAQVSFVIHEAQVRLGFWVSLFVWWHVCRVEPLHTKTRICCAERNVLERDRRRRALRKRQGRTDCDQTGSVAVEKQIHPSCWKWHSIVFAYHHLCFVDIFHTRSTSLSLLNHRQRRSL